MHVFVPMRRRFRFAARARILGALLVLSVPVGVAHGLTLTNVQPVNVSAGGFFILWQASEPALPSVEVYADPAGVTNLAGQVGEEAFPMHTGNLSANDSYERRLGKRQLQAKTRQFGQMLVRISDCRPGTTYYYRVTATATNGTRVSWPATGPLPAVTTASGSSFVLHSKQLLLDLPDANAQGRLVTVSTTNAPYALCAVVGDGAGTNQVYFNLSDLLALTGDGNYEPSGTIEFTAEVLSPGVAHGESHLYTLLFPTGFAVADSEVHSFTGEAFLQMALGSTMLEPGQQGVVPIRLSSSAGVSTLIFELDYPAGRLTNMTLEALSPEIGFQELIELSPTNSQVTLLTTTTPVLGDQVVARLHFSTVSNQSSAFIRLHPRDVIALKGDGSDYAPMSIFSGRVTMVGEEPLLETVLREDRQRALTVYGKPWSSIQLEYSTDLVSWKQLMRAAMTNFIFTAEGLTAGQTVYYRAYRFEADPPLLDAGLAANRTGNLMLYGQPGNQYELQYSTNFGSPLVWHPLLQYSLTNAFRPVASVSATNPIVLYRIEKK